MLDLGLGPANQPRWPAEQLPIGLAGQLQPGGGPGGPRGSAGPTGSTGPGGPGGGGGGGGGGGAGPPPGPPAPPPGGTGESISNTQCNNGLNPTLVVDNWSFYYCLCKHPGHLQTIVGLPDCK